MAGKRSSQLKKIIKRYWRSHLSDDIRFLAAASADDFIIFRIWSIWPI